MCGASLVKGNPMSKLREIKMEGTVYAGPIKIYEDNGEVKLVDEKSNLRVYMPVAEWWIEWQKLKIPPNSWSYVDVNNNSLLSITSFIDLTANPPKTDISIVINKIEVSENFKKIHQFSRGRPK